MVKEKITFISKHIYNNSYFKPKVKRLNKIVHPNSRAASKINKQEHRKLRTKKYKLYSLYPFKIEIKT